MSRQPVMVIHGVANTDEAVFNDKVATLSESLGGQWDLVPVFWNQAGSDPQGIEATIPPFTIGHGKRSVAGEVVVPASVRAPGIEILNLGAERAAAAAGPKVRAARSNRDVVVAAAVGSLGGSARPGGRARRSVAGAPDVAKAIEDAWGDLEYLPELEDPRILAQVGKLVADAVSGAGGSGTGTGTTATATRRGILDVGDLVRSVLHGADQLAGAMIGVVGEAVNSAVRTAVIPAFAKGAGDVLVYQSHRADIGRIVRQKLAEHGGIGTAAKPAMVLGHSLGGIIAFDLAVGPDPIHWSALVTFGSQSSILHVLDPRSTGSLAKYDPDPYTPVKLPPTVGKWTNIFEPWDVLAFFASKVFDGESKKRIVDIEIPHNSSSGLWTHSVYWTDENAIEAMREALLEATPPD